jgi:DNA-binding NtrC family response regulator
MGHILIIDDDEQLRKMIRKTMEQAGHRVDELENGSKAMERYCENHYDVIITDIIMPEKEGVETIIEICSVYPEAAIIAMSGGGRISSTDCLSMAGNLGARYVFSKPFERKQLLQAVEEIISSRKKDYETQG